MTEHWHSNRTQVYWTCKALTEGRTINHMDEIGEVKGWRLGAIVHTLRHQYQWPIETDYRGPERIAYYFLKPGYDWQAFSFPPSAIGVRDDLKAAQEAKEGRTDE
ncbi:hypothetical protein [Aliiroseovarius sp. F47248L]|uniref:hypothetical protein n=1 Tax=Aliiroseovarius sp. F47248L TaxID=2926420 RepID=UPI001FF3866A|nr:hypothetical protein [Aliiroseovarius sp. F47248L]MCK0139272.1 hypothetical protein [Aliiroseovarius sp. F47248L]